MKKTKDEIDERRFSKTHPVKVRFFPGARIKTHCPSTPAAIRFRAGNLNLIERFQRGNIKKVKFTRAFWFFTEELSKNYFLKMIRFHIKYVVTLAKIQSAREASHHLTLITNYQTFYSYIVPCLCVNVLRIVGLSLGPNSKVQGECNTSYFEGTIGGGYF